MIIEDCSPLPEDGLDECVEDLRSEWKEYVEDDSCAYDGAAAAQCYEQILDDTCDDLYDDALAIYTGAATVAEICDGVRLCDAE